MQDADGMLRGLPCSLQQHFDLFHSASILCLILYNTKSHVKIQNWDSALNDSWVLFLNSLRSFYSSATSCNHSADLWQLIDVPSQSQLQSQEIYLSQHLFQAPYSRKKPKKPRFCWNKLLLLVGSYKYCILFSDIFIFKKSFF